MDYTYLTDIQLLNEAQDRNIALMSPLDRHNCIKKIVNVDKKRRAFIETETIKQAEELSQLGVQEIGVCTTKAQPCNVPTRVQTFEARNILECSKEYLKNLSNIFFNFF